MGKWQASLVIVLLLILIGFFYTVHEDIHAIAKYLMVRG